MSKEQKDEISFELPKKTSSMYYEDSRYYRLYKPQLVIEKSSVKYPQQEILSFEEI